MTPLPAPLGAAVVAAHRLDRKKHARHWDSGEGAFQVGGRWNPVRTRAVYCSLDPSTAVLEVAVHKGFAILDTDPHVMTSFTLSGAAPVRVFGLDDIPELDSLDPNCSDPARRGWGDAQLAAHPVIVLPSAVSRRSWNLVFRPPLPPGWIEGAVQERFVLDPRLSGWG